MTTNLHDLNPIQIQAVKQTQGALLILAGAGTGKTKTLTTRIAYIIQENLATPYEILAITFTNKASSEMKKRIASILNIAVSNLYIGTFHSICRRILNIHTADIGYSSNFTILDTDDTTRLVKQILKDKNLDEKLLPPKLVLSVISKWKNDLILPYSVVPESPKESSLLDIYKTYQATLKTLNAMDFDDLILQTIYLFKNNKEVLQTWQKRFKYVLVDEYQDTNMAQYALIRLIAAGYGNICCVGDDDQSIYSWRGAKIENILNFKTDYPDALILRLEQNYRSTTHILKAANGLISNNVNRLGKDLWTNDIHGEKIKIKIFPDANLENRFLARDIEKLKIQGANISEVAILVRLGWQTRSIEDELIRFGIPYRIIGSKKFYEREEIKDVISYLRVVYQPNDDLALLRIINKPARGIGDTSISKLRTIANSNSTSLFTAITNTDITNQIKGKAGAAMLDFAKSFLEFRDKSLTLNPSDLTNELVETSGYMDKWRAEDTEESKGRQENIKELINALKNFETLEEFIDYVSLISDEDENSDSEINQQFVSIMTIHRAKGLEFENVYLPGWEEEIFPSPRALEEEPTKGVEEERRLAYVAITRAKKNLTISYATSRMIFRQLTHGVASRFIREIPEEHREIEGSTSNFNQFSVENSNNVMNRIFASENSTNTKNLPYYGDDTAEQKQKFKIGDKALHQVFGVGKVVESSSSTVIVEFENGIRKKIIPAFITKV